MIKQVKLSDLKYYLNMLKKRPRLWQWGAFALFFAYFWRTYNLFADLPAYGDALEVVWGIIWYNHAITEFVNPFYYPLMFHPAGWQVGILAHTPLLFLLAQPFYWLGGEVFAYNLLAIIPFFISYAGALRFFRHYTKSPITAVVVSLAFTFVTMRSSRIWGHLHVLWATSFFPWLGDALLQWRSVDDDSEAIWHKRVWLSGLLWGVMIAFSLYAVFFVPILFLLLERRLFRWRKVPQLLTVAGVALLIGATALLPYYFAIQREPIPPSNIQSLIYWSSSLNNLFIPSSHHSLSVIKELSRFFNDTRGGEGLYIGLSTLLLSSLGIYSILSRRDKSYGRLLVALVGIAFALGPMLKYNNELVESDLFVSLNEFLWESGHAFKPDLFLTEVIPDRFAQAIPLPGYWLTVFVPFWEGARTVSRFVLVGFVGVLGLAAAGIDILPQKWRGVVIVIFLIEMMPITTERHTLNLAEIHPAHQWLMAQPRVDGEGIVDMRGRIMQGPESLYLSWQTQWPSASAIGSFVPQQNRFLRDIVDRWASGSPEELVRILDAYQIRYVMVHRTNNGSAKFWEFILNAPDDFTAVGCFDPPETYLSPWAYPICIAEVKSHPTIANIFPIYGFSEPESWGMWSIEERPRFHFVAPTIEPYRLSFDAFPHCIDGQKQTMRIISDGELLYQYEWLECEDMHGEVIIPADHIEIGWNEVSIEIEYAISPSELDISNDPRSLAVGFSSMKVRTAE